VQLCNWSEGSLREAIRNFAGSKPRVNYTDNGKTVYTTPITGASVTYDNAGNYFRIQNGKGQYLDQNGNLIPPNVSVIGPRRTTETGVPKDVRNGLTHFKNIDPIK
jgi:hypothetical protein